MMNRPKYFNYSPDRYWSAFGHNHLTMQTVKNSHRVTVFIKIVCEAVRWSTSVHFIHQSTGGLFSDMPAGMILI